MRITITQNGETRTFIVKIQHDFTKPTVKHEKDQFGRDIYTIWRERKTTVGCSLWDESSEPRSKTVYVGTTTCKYQDSKQYSKSTGRAIAWCRCLEEMVKAKIFDLDAIKMLSPLTLNGTAFEINVDTKTVKKTT